MLAVTVAYGLAASRRRDTQCLPLCSCSDDTIVSAAPPPQIVERGKLGDTLIVEALCDKYIEHQPIERQATRFARAGVDIASQTLGRSVAAAIDLLMPVAKLIEEQTRGPGLLGTDATGIPILDPAETMGIRTGAIWCRRKGQPRSTGRGSRLSSTPGGHIVFVSGLYVPGLHGLSTSPALAPSEAAAKAQSDMARQYPASVLVSLEATTTPELTFYAVGASRAILPSTGVLP